MQGICLDSKIKMGISFSFLFLRHKSKFVFDLDLRSDKAEFFKTRPPAAKKVKKGLKINFCIFSM